MGTCLSCLLVTWLDILVSKQACMAHQSNLLVTWETSLSSLGYVRTWGPCLSGMGMY